MRSSPQLIAICGLATSGKGEVAKILFLNGFMKTKLAAPIKAMMAEYYRYCGVDEKEIWRKLEGDMKEMPCRFLGGKTPRYAMQTLGTEWGRETISLGLWVEPWREIAADKLRKGLSVVVDDVRFPDEVCAIKDMGGTVWKVQRDVDHLPGDHESERWIDCLDCDLLIENNGSLADLRAKVEAALTSRPLQGTL